MAHSKGDDDDAFERCIWSSGTKGLMDRQFEPNPTEQKCPPSIVEKDAQSKPR